MKKLSALLYLSLAASMIHGMEKQESPDIPDEEMFFATLAKIVVIPDDVLKVLMQKEQECREKAQETGKSKNLFLLKIEDNVEYMLIRASIFCGCLKEEKACEMFAEISRQEYPKDDESLEKLFSNI